MMEGFKGLEEACNRETTGFPEPSIVSLLNTLDLSCLEEVLSEVYSKKKRRPPHSPSAMLKALIFQKIRQIPSWRKLANTLKTEPTWLPVLGLRKAPCHGSFSVFTKRLGPNRFQEMFRFLLKQLKPSLSNLGQHIAIDSTIVKGYVNPRKHGIGGLVSDPDARWGVTGQIVNKPIHVFGYKLQIACDADIGLPLVYTVVSANKSDMQLFRDTLLKSKETENPAEVVIADAGYDSKRNILLTLKYRGIPIIKLNPRGTKKNHRRSDYLLPVQRDSDAWRRYYNLRVSIERIFSRLKLELGLEHLKLRHIERVEVHFATCLIAMIAIALAAVVNGHTRLARCIEPWRYFGQ
jgi:transposase